MNSLKNLLTEGKPLLADGAMGSLLIQRGFNTRECLALLNISQPQLVQNIHREYAQAGAELIYTHSFQAHPLQLRKFGLASRFKQIMQSAANNALVAGKLVAGVIGPSGLEKDEIGKHKTELRHGFTEQAGIFAGEKVDVIVLETFTCFEELQMAVSAVQETVTGKLPVIVCATPGKKGHLSDNTQLESWVDYLNAQEVAAIGVNCVPCTAELIDLVIGIAARTTKPLLIKPNAGLPQKIQNQWRYPVDAQSFSSLMHKFPAGAVKVIGGCCGTTPEYIQKLHEELTAN